MDILIKYLQIISGASLIGLVLIQSKGKGLGRSFGASGSSSFKRRGLESVLYRITFGIAGIFLLLSIVQLLV